MICFTIRFETRSCGNIFIASTVCSLRHVRAAICSAIRSGIRSCAVSASLLLLGDHEGFLETLTLICKDRFPHLTSFLGRVDDLVVPRYAPLDLLSLLRRDAA